MLASIGQLEFFYDQAPDVMRSCSMALQLLSVALGSYLSGALVWGVSALTARLGLNQGLGWLPRDLNHGRLDLFFLLLAGRPSQASTMFICRWAQKQETIKPADSRQCPCKPNTGGTRLCTTHRQP